MFYLFLADGFEETEALAPLDMMRRAKIEVKTVGVTGEFVTGSHGVTVKADLKPEEISLITLTAWFFRAVCREPLISVNRKL